MAKPRAHIGKLPIDSSYFETTKNSTTSISDGWDLDEDFFAASLLCRPVVFTSLTRGYVYVRKVMIMIKVAKKGFLNRVLGPGGAGSRPQLRALLANS